MHQQFFDITQSVMRRCLLMPKDVMCEVSSCNYWGNGNLCQADQIYVVTHVEEEKARTTEETDCHTFKPKLH